MSKKPKKQTFAVAEDETIADCLERMKKQGYVPTRRIERPVFSEVIENGKKEIVPIRQKIIFEGKLVDDTADC